MNVVRVSSQDPRVDAYRSLQDAELFRRRGLFIAEGRLVVERLIALRRYALESLLMSEIALLALAPALAALDPGVPIYVCGAGDFPGITGYNVHRGCLALARRPLPPPLESLLARARCVIVLDAVTNADNVGGVFRNAAAFAADAVILDPSSCDPLYRKAIRTSMGAALRVPFARPADRPEDWPGVLAGLGRRGFALMALTPAESARDLGTIAPSEWPERIALLLGSESRGLCAAAEAIADHQVRIPIDRDVDSLNLAVAAGIALHAIARGRRPPAGR